VKVREACLALEELAPPGFAYDWDKPGLRIGNPNEDVSKVLVALTVTRAVYDRARELGAQLIVSHHPLLWEPLKALRTDDPAVRLCVDLAHDNIACYAAHTNLDVVPGGVNTLLAERLGLLECRPLLPSPAAQVKLVTFVPESQLEALRRAVCEAGAGVIGEYTHCSFSAPGVGTFLPGDAAQPFSGEKHRVNEEPERRFETLVDKARLPRVLDALRSAHPYEEPAYDIVPLENTNRSIGLGARGRLPEPTTLDRFAQSVRAALDVDHVRVAGASDCKVQTVAVIGGAGGGELKRIPRDVDVLVTGDVRYHDAVDALERGLAVIDAGHDGTERFIVASLTNYLTEKLPSIQVFPFEEPCILRAATY
jgi:dinuclear metal center YbgI/SA1388 family protein